MGTLPDGFGYRGVAPFFLRAFFGVSKVHAISQVDEICSGRLAAKNTVVLDPVAADLRFEADVAFQLVLQS